MKDMPVDDTKDQARGPIRRRAARTRRPGVRPRQGRKTPLSEDTGVHRATPVRPAPGTVAREGLGTSDDGRSAFRPVRAAGTIADARRGAHGAPSREGEGGTAVRGRPDAYGTRQAPDARRPAAPAGRVRQVRAADAARRRWVRRRAPGLRGGGRPGAGGARRAVHGRRHPASHQAAYVLARDRTGPAPTPSSSGSPSGLPRGDGTPAEVLTPAGPADVGAPSFFAPSAPTRPVPGGCRPQTPASR